MLITSFSLGVLLGNIICTRAPRCPTHNPAEPDFEYATRPTAETLRENKRELFDGMRAYHQSEISHANHAITMLLAIAAAAGAVVLAIIFPRENFQREHLQHVSAIAWGLFFIVTVFVSIIWATTHQKINADHGTYERYGIEYMKTSRLLGCYARVNIDGKEDSIKDPCWEIGKGTGYRKTQRIILSFAVPLIVLTFLFAFLLPHYLEARIQSLVSIPTAAPKLSKMHFSTDELFDFDKAILKHNPARDQLDKFAAGLKTLKYDSINVVGYTDRIGSEEYNQRLSLHRAEAVKSYLITQGVPSGKILVEGKGKADPITRDRCKGSEETEALIGCLQPDRRVEVEVDGTQETR
jgi:outer membrane protein OmpA-like peptidoglycan-associated protein